MDIAKILADRGIWVDFNEEILYGEDQVYVDYPKRFPTVTFELVGTPILIELANAIRELNGFITYDDPNRDSVYYNFYFGLNWYTDTHTDNSIVFVVVGSGLEDNEQEYTIDLTEDEKLAIYNTIDWQAGARLGKDCEDLLREAWEMMKEYEKENADGL